MINIQEAAIKELNKKTSLKSKAAPHKASAEILTESAAGADKTGRYAIQHKNGRWVSLSYNVGSADKRATFDTEADAEAFISDNGAYKRWKDSYTIIDLKGGDKTENTKAKESLEEKLTRAFGGQYLDLYDEVYDALAPDMDGMNQKAKRNKVLVQAFAKFGEPYKFDEVFAMARAFGHPGHEGIKVVSNNLARAEAVAKAFGLDYEVSPNKEGTAYIYVPSDAPAVTEFVEQP